MSVEDWVYKGEGNSCLVVANTKDCTVLRLEKHKISREGKRLKVDYDDMKQEVERLVEFQTNVMSPLIGPSFLLPWEMVLLEDGFVENINTLVASLRPESRCDKECDPACRYAIKMRDATQHTSSQSTSPVYCVEIKPKSGLLLGSDQATKYNLKHTTCKFCMHQHRKMLHKKWPSLSAYCPLDLYSGNRKRMVFALHQLFKTPQNNLRLFKSGHLIYSEEKKASSFPEHLQDFIPEDENSNPCSSQVLDDFISVVVECLLHKCSDSDSNGVITKRPSCSASSFKPRQTNHNEPGDVDTLPSDCVLGRIFRAQNIAGSDIEGLWPTYEKVLDHFKTHPQSRVESCMDGPFSSQWLSALSENAENDSTVSSHDILQIKKYLVSRSAQDCSIMISIQPAQESENAGDHQIVKDKYGRKFAFSVSVIDADKKSFDKMQFWKKEDEEILEHYQNVMKTLQSRCDM